MRTKEAIVKEKYELAINKGIVEEWAFPAMDEYAKEISIGFAEFCGRYGDKGPDGTWSEHMWSGNIMNGEPDLTTEQLFDLYLQETSKP